MPPSKAFNASIVEPVKCLLNISAPVGALGVHIDLLSFRGFVPAHETKHLLMAMIHSDCSTTDGKRRCFATSSIWRQLKIGTSILPPPIITDAFLQDLRKKGISEASPSDPLDPEWQQFLAKSYPQPFSPATADYIS